MIQTLLRYQFYNRLNDILLELNLCTYTSSLTHVLEEVGVYCFGYVRLLVGWLVRPSVRQFVRQSVIVKLVRLLTFDPQT